jgi:apolipoprotein N-acyltransferase
VARSIRAGYFLERVVDVSDAGNSLSRIESWFAARTPWQRRGLALVSGALATLAHAPFQLTFLFAVAIVVLVWLLDTSSAKPKRMWSAFSMGWFFGLGHFTTGLYWIASAFMVDSNAWGPLWGIPATLALAGGLAIFWGLGCAMAVAFWTRDIRRIAAFAVCVLISEWLRGNILTGFPWLLPGYVWTPGEPVSQLASLLGIYGLSLLTLLAAAAPATVGDGRLSAGMRFAPVLVVALAFGLAWGWGAQRIANAAVDQPGARPIVRVADSGISQAEKWRYRPDQEWRVLQRYLEASEEPDVSRADIVIWPEGAIPTLNFFMLDNEAFLAAIGQGMGDRVLVAGVTRCEPRPACDAFMRGEGGVAGLRLYNSAAVIDGVSGEARVSQVYDKHHLVPFGEYIPFWNLVSRLNIAPLQRIGAGFNAGPPPARLVIPGADPAVVLICYEAIFPGMTPHGEERPDWLISVTNDAWFGQGTGPHQHFAMARYRAIEEGMPMVRAASGGISAIVDSYGRVVRSTQRQGGVEAQLPPTLQESSLSSWRIVLLAALLVIISGLRFFPIQARAAGRKP